MQFAKAITLGTAIGGYLEPVVDKHVVPVAENLAPPEYKRWVAPLLHYAVQSIAISIAWTLQRIISVLLLSVCLLLVVICGRRYTLRWLVGSWLREISLSISQ